MKKTANQAVNERLDFIMSDPAYIARVQEKERVRMERVAKLIAAEAPIVEALNKAGVEVQSTHDLTVVPVTKFPAAIPVLMEHLTKDYPIEILATIARALQAPEAVDFLLDMYSKTSEYMLKEGLASSILASSKKHHAQKILDLIRDPNQGDSRVLLLYALKKFRIPSTELVIDELSHDPTFEPTITRWRKKKC